MRDFRDGFFPYDGARRSRTTSRSSRRDVSPDLIFTHQRDDLHQDHRLVSELTWNTFRDHLILEYEIPKYDGDLGTPNLFVPLDETSRSRKVDAADRRISPRSVPSTGSSEDLFTGLLRLRGMECELADGHAEAFYCRKAVLA